MSCDVTPDIKKGAQTIGIDWAMLTVEKTIYDIRNKSKGQITEILLAEEDHFLNSHPDYEYQRYSKIDGRFGERTITLYFKRK